MLRELARRALVAALLAVALVTSLHCSSKVAEPATVQLVLGIGQQCVDELRWIDVKATTADRLDHDDTILITDPSMMPVVEPLAFPIEAGAVHDVTATFNLVTHTSEQTQASLGISFPDGTTGRVLLSLPCVCLGVHCPDGYSCFEEPTGSGMTQCEPNASCGDGTCTAGETCASCPADCMCSCGDGQCNNGETCASCPVDCGSCCGNGKCDASETCSTCTKDCGNCTKCGNMICEIGEDPQSCPQDCKGSCGNGMCDNMETCSTCPADCGSCCGNGLCEMGETCMSCSADCGQCIKCGNQICEVGESCGNCPGDCPCSCGDKICSQGENCSNCPADCGSCCGNMVCDPGETCATCAQDCGMCQGPTCSDGMKNGNETDVDCGGGCPGCANGKGCGADSDCQSGLCGGGTCQACGGQTQPCCAGNSCNGSPLACIWNTGMKWGGTDHECNCGSMQSDQVIQPGQQVNSCDGRFYLAMQGDGNLVLYQNGAGALWASNTGGSNGDWAVMQGDGNFVLYGQGNPLWSSGTNVAGSYLAVQNDGNLVVYTPGNSPAWSSNTCCH